MTTGAQWLRPVDAALDEDLLEAAEGGEPWLARVWAPADVAVVLGRGTVADREVHRDACDAAGVPVLRRKGGGGAVVLGPGCVIVSLAATVERELEVGRHLDTIATFLAEVLGRLSGLPLAPRGTGDVCLGDRKVLGSSLFRRRRLLFYQASVLHSLDLSLVDLYLTHPLREPEYRRGRSHREFLTTLAEAGASLLPSALVGGIAEELPVLAGCLR